MNGSDGADGKDGENGKDGADGQTPIIGVRQDTDGIWYWTLNGEWLLDDDGNKIKAVGRDGKDGEDGTDGADGEDGTDGKDGVNGKDGQTPELKIEDGYWYVSYDDGATWTQVGKATGEDGKDGLDGGIFKKVEQTENAIILTLNDGTIITLNKEVVFSINFTDIDKINCIPETTVALPYTLTGAKGESMIAVICQDYWIADVEQIDDTSGKIYVRIPYDTKTESITVIACNSGKTSMATLSFELFFHYSPDYSNNALSPEAHTITLNIKTNTEYIVSIPEEAQNWISKEIETKAFREESIVFRVSQNDLPEIREATIRFINDKGEDMETPYTIRQNFAYIKFADPKVENIFLNSSINSNNDDHISYFEAVNAYSLDDVEFLNIQGKYTFNEFQHFTSIQSITNVSFGPYLSEITLPSSIYRIGSHVFYYCFNLKYLYIPKSVQDIGESAFYYCPLLTLNLDKDNAYFILENGVLFNKDKTKIIGISGTRTGHFDIPETVTLTSGLFYGSNITSISIPSSWTEIPEHAFSSTSLEKVSIPSSITTIGRYAFSGSPITSLILPENLRIIGEGALTLSSEIDIHIPKYVEHIGRGAFNKQNITIDSKNQYYYSDNDGVYSKDMTTLLHVNPSVSGDYVIPDNITKIGYITFYNKDLNSVRISSAVQIIDRISLYNWWSETSVSLGPVTVFMQGMTPPTLNDCIDGNFDTIVVPESAYESYLADDSWGNYNQYLTFDGMKTWSIYGDFDGSGKEQEIKLVRTSEYFIVEDVVISSDVRFRFICNSDTDNSYGAADSDADDSSVLHAEFFTEYDFTDGGADIFLPAGKYDIILAKDLGSFTILPNTWRITGTFNDWGENDIPMTLEDGWYVAYDIEWSEDTGFKFWYDRDWEKGDFGVDYSYIDINTWYHTIWSGNDIYVPAGTYDIYLSEYADIFYVMTAGQTPPSPPQLQQ